MLQAQGCREAATLGVIAPFFVPPPWALWFNLEVMPSCRTSRVLRSASQWLALALLLEAGSRAVLAAAEPTNAFATVEAIFSRHCLDCHAAQDPEGKLVLETFETLSRGGESGPVFLRGKSSESLLVKMVEGAVEKDGKKKMEKKKGEGKKKSEKMEKKS